MTLSGAEWRFLRGWTDAELAERLIAQRGNVRNFEETDTAQMTEERGWRVYGSSAIVGRERPGPPAPDGAFRRGTVGLANYRFSDPSIVVAHFDPESRLHGRRMLLEIKVLGLHYLCGVVVADTRSERNADRTVFGFRYDTLRGHVEAGAEWFLLTKDHETGEIGFRVHARWRHGDFPNWWSRVGFSLLATHYQRRWHVQAHRRLHAIMQDPASASPARPREGLAHEGPRVLFHRGGSEDR